MVCRIRPTLNDTTQVGGMTDDTSNADYTSLMTLGSGGNVNFRFRINSSGNKDMSSSGAFGLDTWYNLIVVCRSATDREMYIGDPTSSVAGSTSETSATLPSGFNAIGIGANVKQNKIYGEVDLEDVAYYDVSLTADERKAFMDGIRPNRIRQKSLKVYVPLVEIAEPVHDHYGGHIFNGNSSPTLVDGPNVQPLFQKQSENAVVYADTAGGATTVTKTLTVGATLEKIITKLTSIGATLSKVIVKDTIIGATLAKIITRDTSVGATLQKVISKTTQLGSTLQKTITKDTIISSTLQKVITKAFSIGATLDSGAVAKQFTIGATLLKSILKTTVLSATLEKIITKSLTIGARLAENITKNTTIGATLQKTISKDTIIGSTLLKIVTTLTTLGSTLQKVLTKDISIGSTLLKSQISKVLTIGATLDPPIGFVPTSEVSVIRKTVTLRTQTIKQSTLRTQIIKQATLRTQIKKTLSL